MALERELATYSARKEELLRQSPGQFVVVHGDDVLGTFSTFAEAFDAGVKEYGTVAFLIQQAVDEPAPVLMPALTVGMISADLQLGNQRPAR